MVHASSSPLLKRLRVVLQNVGKSDGAKSCLKKLDVSELAF